MHSSVRSTASGKRRAGVSSGATLVGNAPGIPSQHARGLGLPCNSHAGLGGTAGWSAQPFTLPTGTSWSKAILGATSTGKEGVGRAQVMRVRSSSSREPKGWGTRGPQISAEPGQWSDRGKAHSQLNDPRNKGGSNNAQGRLQ